MKVLQHAVKELFSLKPGNIAAWGLSALLGVGYVRYQDRVDGYLFGSSMSKEEIEKINQAAKAKSSVKSQ
jgi:hypothetical protein